MCHSSPRLVASSGSMMKSEKRCPSAAAAAALAAAEAEAEELLPPAAADETAAASDAIDPRLCAATAAAVTAVWPASSPLTPARMLIALVQKMTRAAMYALYIHPSSRYCDFRVKPTRGTFTFFKRRKRGCGMETPVPPP